MTRILLAVFGILAILPAPFFIVIGCSTNSPTVLVSLGFSLGVVAGVSLGFLMFINHKKNE